jgi:hypothetical protein
VKRGEEGIRMIITAVYAASLAAMVVGFALAVRKARRM